MTPEILNILSGLPMTADEEDFQTLFESDFLRIERIVSDGQRSAPDFWFDQPHQEWVMLLRGEAVLEFEGGEMRELSPGDSLSIPAHCLHRVAWTGPRTVWLAVHVFA